MWAFLVESWVAFLPLGGERTMLQYLELASTEPEDELREVSAMCESSRKAVGTMHHLLVQMVAARALRCPRARHRSASPTRQRATCVVQIQEGVRGRQRLRERRPAHGGAQPQVG